MNERSPEQREEILQAIEDLAFAEYEKGNIDLGRAHRLLNAVDNKRKENARFNTTNSIQARPS